MSIFSKYLRYLRLTIWHLIPHIQFTHVHKQKNEKKIEYIERKNNMKTKSDVVNVH